MKQLATGQFFGTTHHHLNLPGLSITDTEYTHDFVDWHYHETPYLTFLLDGRMQETSLRNTHQCVPGSLLFHNWQEKHFNSKPPVYTRGFHVEFDPAWLSRYEVDLGSVQGDIDIKDPSVRVLMYQLFKETKLTGPATAAVIDSILIDILSIITKNTESVSQASWPRSVLEALSDQPDHNWDLQTLAVIADVHPVHLSRNFRRYFHCNLGEFLRKRKMVKALSLFPNGQLSLTEIAIIAGFADQSHFIRIFRETYGSSPLPFRRLLMRG